MMLDDATFSALADEVAAQGLAAAKRRGYQETTAPVVVSRALVESGRPGDTLTTRDGRVWEIYERNGRNELRGVAE